MNRGQPVLNKICKYKWELQQNEKLSKRIKGVKANVDNKAPPQYPHLINKRKKEQQMEERYTQIERENRILLQKMSHIMTHSAIDNQMKIKSRSLNATRRRQELERIMQENQSLLKRIQSRKPFLSKKHWQKHHKDHQERLKCMRDVDPAKVVKTKTNRRKKTHKLNPLDHGGFKAYASRKNDKPMGRKENRSKAAENVIYKEGRIIDDKYVIVTVIENIVDRVFSFRTYALETSHQNRVDIPAMTIRDCVDDDSLMRPDHHDDLAMALIPRLRFENEKLVFDTKAQNSEAYEASKKVAAETVKRLTSGKTKSLPKDEKRTKKDISELVDETEKKLTKQMNIANKATIKKQKEEAERKRLAEIAEKERQARLIREAEEKEAEEALAAEAAIAAAKATVEGAAE